MYQVNIFKKISQGDKRPLLCKTQWLLCQMPRDKKKYRERLKQNPVKYEEMRKKHLERVKLNKLKIKEQNQNQNEKTRQKWREYSDRYYKKKKNKSISDPITVNKVTISNAHIISRWKLKTIKLRKELKRCQDALNTSLKKQETMRKQIYRLKQERIINRNQLRGQTIEEEQPSTPTEFEILSESLSSVYKESTHKEKAVIKKIVNNPLTKKYRMATKMGLAIGIKGRIRAKLSFSTKRKLLIQQIHNFYMRDNISRATAGKKECKTKEKTKMQIRFLTDSILNLYTIYKKEGGKASYSTLVRHRPFYVLPPKLHNRETCACIRHANISYKLTKLYKLGLLKTNKIEELLKDTACNLNSKECMYGDCQLCVTKKIEVKDSSNEKTVCWLQWCVKTVPYRKKNEAGVEVEALTKKITREVVTDDLSTLVYAFQEEAKLFKKHFYNMIHQQKSFRECVDRIKENEAVIIVDFSENYQCKYNVEIQSMHFSSSRNQITLHTGVAYLKNENPAGFCSISPNTEHSPITIWAHLLHSIKYQHPEIDTLHMHSDGPTTQYRQKINFALFDKLTKQLGFKHATWSYFEAAYGKNAADGIGGVLKRTLDMHVGYGKDVPNAIEAFKLLRQETNVTLYYVSDTDISVIKETYPIPNLCPLVGTMAVHQIITTDEPGIIKHRHVSCFCGDNRGDCSCFDVKINNLFKKPQKNTETLANVEKKLSIATPKICIRKKEDNDRKKSIKIQEKRADNVQNIYEPSTSSIIKTTNVNKMPVSVGKICHQKQMSDEYKKVSKQKENKPPNQSKKCIRFDCDPSDSDTEVIYAESDDSPYINEESNSESPDITIKPKNKVTILSDIRLHPDNQKYFNFAAPGLSSMHMLDPTHDISSFKTNSNESSDNDSNFDIF